MPEQHDENLARADRYPDLLGTRPDPALRRLIADLDTAYSAPVPPPDLYSHPAWAQPAAGITVRAAAAPSRRWPALRPGPAAADRPPALQRGWLGMAGAVALLLVGVLTASLVIGGGDSGHGGGSPATAVADEFARLAVEHVYQANMVESGTPQVVLSRRIVAADLPCLGLASVYTQQADEPLALVILKGVFRSRNLPGTGLSTLPSGAHYLTYIYLVRQRVLTAEDESWRGDGLQTVLHDPSLPEEDPIPSGMPIANQDARIAGIISGGEGQQMGRTATVNGWTLTVGRVYADSNEVIVLYQVAGPRRAFAIDEVVLRDASGRALPPRGRGEDTRTGTTWEVAWFAGDAGLRTTVPARLQFEVRIRVRPPAPTPTPPPCSAGTPPARDPQPTWTAAVPASRKLAPVVPTADAPPDMLVGPLSVDLAVQVAAATPLPTMPPPVPTKERPLDVAPVPSVVAPLGTPTVRR